MANGASINYNTTSVNLAGGSGFSFNSNKRSRLAMSGADEGHLMYANGKMGMMNAAGHGKNGLAEAILTQLFN